MSRKIILSPADNESLLQGSIVNARDPKTFEVIGKVKLNEGKMFFVSSVKPSTITNGNVVPDLSVVNMEDKGARPTSLTHEETILAMKAGSEGQAIIIYRGSELTSKLKKTDKDYEANAVQYRVMATPIAGVAADTIAPLKFEWSITLNGSLGEEVELA